MPGNWVASRRSRLIAFAAMRVRTVLLAALLANALFVWWGAPDSWNPDEIAPREAVRMAATLDFRPEAPGNPTLHAYALVAVAAAPERLLHGIVSPAMTPIEFVTGAARVISVLVATALAAAVASAARRRGAAEDVAALAAAFVGANSLVIAAAHSATVDAPAALLLFLAVERAARAADGREGPRAYFVAGVLGGLAVATKYTALLPVLTVVAAAFRGAPGRRMAAAVAGASGLAAGFAAGMPLVLVHPYDVAATFVVSHFHVALLHGPDAPRAGFGVAATWALAAGPALLGVAAGLAGSRRSAGTAVFLAAAAASVLPAAFARVSEARYLLPAIAPCVAAAAHGLSSISLARRRALLAAAALWAALAVSQYPLDARHGARRWLVDHLPAGATVAVTPYGPNLRGFEVVKLRVPHTGALAYPAMEREPIFRTLRGLGRELGGGPAPAARRVVQGLIADAESSAAVPTLDELRARGVRAVVVSTAAAGRFEFPAVRAAYPRTAALLDGLRAGSSEFVLAARFGPALPAWIRPPVEWTDAAIEIYVAR